MNKRVLIINIQKIITYLQLTISNLENILSKDKSYSKEQLQRTADMLCNRLQDNDIYNIPSNKFTNLKLLLRKVNGEIGTLKKLIEDTNFRIKLLQREIEKKRSLLSYKQRDLETLVDSLNISDNDNDILKLINTRKEEMACIKSGIVKMQSNIDIEFNSINNYNEKIKQLNGLIGMYQSELESTDEFDFNYDKNQADTIKFNRLNSAIKIINKKRDLEKILFCLEDLLNYLVNNEIEKKIIDEKVLYIRSLIADMNGEMLEYTGCIAIADCLKSRKDISNRLSSKKGYLISEAEHNENLEEIFGYQLELSLYDNEILSDEQILLDYNQEVNRINDEIDSKKNKINVLQLEIDELKLSRVYLLKDSIQNESENIKREIKKKQREIILLTKHIEKLIKNRTYIELAIANIKKKMKNASSLKEEKIVSLKEKKVLDKYSNRYNLEEDKKEIVFMDLIISLFDFANDFLDKKYLQRLDDIEVESLEPFIGIIGFYKYHDVALLYDADFIRRVKDCISSKFTESKNGQYISYLKSQGLSVVQFGEYPVTLADKETNKVKVA